jgi:hypothetical protein
VLKETLVLKVLSEHKAMQAHKVLLERKVTRVDKVL